MGKLVVYAEPASLSLEPIQLKVKEGDTFEVKVNIYTGQRSTASSDIYIDYDSSLLEALPAKTENGDLFSLVDAKIINPGRLYLSAIEDNRDRIQPEIGTVATIYFKARHTGQTQLDFVCNEYGNHSSQIIKGEASLENIISCPSTTTHTSSIQIDPASAVVLGAQSPQAGYMLNFIGLGLVMAGVCYFAIRRYQQLKITKSHASRDNTKK